MSLKTKLLTYLLCNLCILSFSQKTAYIDENMNAIDSITYYQKCSYQGFKCLEYKNDTLNFKKVLYKHLFGKLDSIPNQQIRKIISLDSKKLINPNDVLIILYAETLLNYEHRKVNYDRHIQKHLQKENQNTSVTFLIHHDEFNEKYFSKSLREYSKTQNKCIKKFQRKANVNVFHFYNNDEQMLEKYSKLNWIKDRNVLKSTFFNVVYNYSFAILKPDGNYFLSGGHLSDIVIKEIVENPDWSRYKSDWELTMTDFKRYGSGIFERYENHFHENHCF